MKKLYLQKITQYSSTCYVGLADPRELVKVATKIEMSVTQDAQRPLNEKRVKDIAAYVGNESGILPNTLTLATKDDRFTVQLCDEEKQIYCIDFPSTEEEYNKFKDAIDVMDGQHRLYSFADDLRLISDNANYEIGFTLYIRPTLDERRRIFISCNEKQEKVSGNLLMWFKEKLNMLTSDEKAFYGVVSKLSNEFPLKGHIIMSAEKIKSGVKAKEVTAALKQAKVQDMAIGGNPLTDEQKVRVICTYLSAWQAVVGFSFDTSTSKAAGAAKKMAGLKYMLLLLPAVWERAIALRKNFDQTFVEDTLKRFFSSCGVEKENFFTCDENKMYFRDRSGVDMFANQSVIKIKAIGAEDFNPLG